jgi:hypothetical protein
VLSLRSPYNPYFPVASHMAFCCGYEKYICSWIFDYLSLATYMRHLILYFNVSSKEMNS